MVPQKDSARSSKTEKKTSKSKKTTVKAPAPAASFKSAEKVQESEDEETNDDTSSEDEEVESSKKVTVRPSKTNGSVAVASSSSESDESESEADSKEDEDSEGSSSEDEESEELEESKSPAQTVSASQVAKPSDPRTVSFKDAPPFVPPRGFETKSIDQSTLTAANLFSKSNLEGKEIWYITSPASTPISAIKEISLKALKRGKPVLSQGGNNYGFVEDDAEDNGFTKVIVPNGSDKGYRTSSSKFSRILHLQQMVDLPSQDNGSEGADVPSRATVPTKRPPRQQPNGLRMRFNPIGYGDGDAGTLGSPSDSDSEDDGYGVASKRLKVIDALPESDVEMADAPILPKKSKSHKASTSVSEVPVEKTKKKHKESGSSKKSKKDKISKA